MRSKSRASSTASDDNNSQYSVNLDALPQLSQDDSTFDLSQINRHLIDVVRTDDIDGPTDFTQNLEYWMRLKLPNVVEPTTLEGQGKMDLEQYISSEEALSSTIDAPHTPKETTLDLAQVVNVEDIKGTIERRPTGAVHDFDDDKASTGSPPPHIPTVDGPDDDAEDVQSDSSPSRRPRSKLQPSVEDHDDTPLNMRGTRASSVSRLGDNQRNRGDRHRSSSDAHHRRGHTFQESSNDYTDPRSGEHGKAHNQTAQGKSYAEALQATRSPEDTRNRDQHATEHPISPPSPGQSMITRRLREDFDEYKRDSHTQIKLKKRQHKQEMQRERNEHEGRSSHALHQMKEMEHLLKKEKEEVKERDKRHHDLLQKSISFEIDLALCRKNLKELRKELDNSELSNQQKSKESKQNLDRVEAEYKEKLAELQKELVSASALRSPDYSSDLESQLTKVKQQLLDSDQKITDLQKKLADRDNALYLAEQRAEEAETGLEIDGQAHREEIQHEQEIHDMQVSALEEQATSLKKDLSASHQQLADTLRELREIQGAVHHGRESLAENENRMRELQEENEALHNKVIVAIERRQATNAKLAATNDQNTQELNHIQATQNQENLNIQKAAESAVLKMRKLLDKERRETTLLRTQLKQSGKVNNFEHEELEDLRNEVQIANDHVEDTERERDQLKHEIQRMDKALENMLIESRKVKEKLHHAEREMQNLQEKHLLVNDMVTLRITEAVQVKQREWKRKITELEKEIEIRGKLLMIEWGRSEIGASDPQPYKYKYLSGLQRP